MTPAPNIETYLDDLIASLRKTVPLALRKWDEEAIHDARVATRRMKAALDALCPLFPVRLFKPFAKTLRQIRRRLGPLRDIDVLLGHLRQMERYAAYAPGCAWMRRHLLHEQDELRKECQEKAQPSKLLAELGAWWGLKDSVTDINQDAPPLVLAALPSRIDVFFGRARQLQGGKEGGKGVRNLLPERPEGGFAQKVPDPFSSHPFSSHEQTDHPAGDPHAVRIAGKALRYTLELTSAAALGPSKKVLRRFKELQDALGLWHDYAVLSQRVMMAAIDEEIPYHSPAAYTHLIGLSRAAWHRAESRLERFVTVWNSRGPATMEEVAALLPDLRPTPDLSAAEVQDSPPATEDLHAPSPEEPSL